MLLSLKIENYALIRSSNITFHSGFSSITGETGAGKSIMLGALALVLGGRADTQVLFDKNKKCIVEATFSVCADKKSVFDDNDLDFETQSVFRREITPNGKSRAFINDTPVQLSVMKLFADFLIDIHSQSATIKLKNNDFQLSILDSLIDNKEIIDSYQKEFNLYRTTEKQIKELEYQQNQLVKEKSYNTFLFEELEQANLQEGEQEEKSRMLELATNAENIKENIAQSLKNLDNEQGNSILGLLNETSYRLNRIASHNKELAELYNRLESASIELKDIYEELSSFNENLDFDEGKLAELSDRLNLIFALEKKHNVKNITELLAIKDDLQNKLYDVDKIDEELKKMQLQKTQSFKRLEKLASNLTSQRDNVGKILSKEVKPLLDMMAMKDAVLQIEITPIDNFTNNGKDKVRFLFNANKTKENNLKDLSNVISGGELSRLMLAIKTVMAKRRSNISDDSMGITLVFDEIDTGISGDIASKVADIMRAISENHQVITITHLAQMAAKSDNHYKVFKQTTDEETQSNIAELDKQQRIEELAKMLSGDTVTAEALANARTLLNI